MRGLTFDERDFGMLMKMPAPLHDLPGELPCFFEQHRDLEFGGKTGHNQYVEYS